MKIPCTCTALFFTVLMFLSGCIPDKTIETPAKKSTEIKIGSLYATQNEDKSWSITKVLAVDEKAVHLRAYANKFKNKPQDIAPDKLTLGGIDSPVGMGIGHFPLAKEGFFKDKPVFLKVVPVKEEELEGYRMYLDAMKSTR